MSIVAIAKRRKLLDDDLVVSLADSSWEILDISGSVVSDSGLVKVAEMCKSLRALNISRCNKITSMGVSELVQHCRSLETLRCGGCPSSESTARRSLSVFKPNLSNIEGETWEELDATEIGHGGHSLRWLVWVRIVTDMILEVSKGMEQLEQEESKLVAEDARVFPKGPMTRSRAKQFNEAIGGLLIQLTTKEEELVQINTWNSIQVQEHQMD